MIRGEIGWVRGDLGTSEIGLGHLGPGGFPNLGLVPTLVFSWLMPCPFTIPNEKGTQPVHGTSRQRTVVNAKVRQTLSKTRASEILSLVTTCRYVVSET